MQGRKMNLSQALPPATTPATSPSLRCQSATTTDPTSPRALTSGVAITTIFLCKTSRSSSPSHQGRQRQANSSISFRGPACRSDVYISKYKHYTPLQKMPLLAFTCRRGPCELACCARSPAQAAVRTTGAAAIFFQLDPTTTTGRTSSPSPPSCHMS